MTDNEIKKLIDDTVTAAVLKLKAAGLLQSGQRSAYDKTEALLRQYKELCKIDQPYAKRLVAEIDACLADMGTDQYIGLVTKYYFEDKKNMACAIEVGCDERTARRRRRQLVEQISVRLASEDFIRELLL